MTDPVIIIGAGQAGGECAIALRKEGYSGPIVVIGEEESLPYQRPPLSKGFLKGDIPQARLLLRSADFYHKKEIEFRLKARVVDIDPIKHKVILSNGDQQDYSKLIIATGSRVRRLPLPVEDDLSLHYIRTIEDVEQLQSKLKGCQKIAIIGAGFIGLEAAAVLRHMKKEVTVLEREDRVMARVVAPELSEFYESRHQYEGVELLTGFDIKSIHRQGGGIVIESREGENISADAIIVGIGVLPNSELAGTAGLGVENGITVSETCQTSDGDIYAIGECCCFSSTLYDRVLRLESVQNAVDQARIVAKNITGQDISYHAVPWFWSDQYDVKLQMAGLSEGYDKIIWRGRREDGKFSLFYVKQGRLIAVDSINQPPVHMAARKLIDQGITPNEAQIKDGTFKLKGLLG